MAHFNTILTFIRVQYVHKIIIYVHTQLCDLAWSHGSVRDYVTPTTMSCFYHCVLLSNEVEALSPDSCSIGAGQTVSAQMGKMIKDIGRYWG